MTHASRRGFRSVLMPIGVLVSMVLAPSLASAQAAENKAAARTLGIEGIKQANAGDCAGAIEKLSRAEALYHAPTILGRLGECQVEVGRLVEGTENLNRVVREALPENAPEAFIKARERAQRVLDEALPKIAKLKIVVEPMVEGVSVTVGEKSVPPALLGAERPTDPGTHQITVNAPGHLSASAEVTLSEGGQETVNIALVPQEATSAAATNTVTDEPDAASPIDDGGQSKDHTLSYVLWGVGGVGIATGAVTGLMAIGKKGDLDDTCPESRCPASAQGTIDSANNLALISTIGFGVGIASAVAGTVLFFTGKSGASASDTALPTVQVKGITASAFVSPTGAGLSGHF